MHIFTCTDAHGIIDMHKHRVMLLSIIITLGCCGTVPLLEHHNKISLLEIYFYNINIYIHIKLFFLSSHGIIIHTYKLQPLTCPNCSVFTKGFNKTNASS